MAEYIEKDAAIRTLEKEPVFSDAWNALREVRDRIRGLPATDVIPVIRCQDCAKLNRNGYCTRFQNNISGIVTSWFMPDDDDFCSYGKRKEEADG